MDIEDMKFTKSEVIENLLLDWGGALCLAVKNADAITDLEAIRLIAIEFRVLTETYSDSINAFNESLGVSLIESIEFKIKTIKTKDGSNEWQHYLADDELALKELSKR